MAIAYQGLAVANDKSPFGNWFAWKVDSRAPMYTMSQQRSYTGRFLNFSLNADGNFGISVNGSLAMVPQLAQVAAIIQGILGAFGLTMTAPEPPDQLKTITIDPGVTLATLFGASQGLNFLVQLLKGKIQAIQNYVTSAITSIQNLIKCVLKNPLLAAQLLAKIIRQGWVTIPPGFREALIAARDLINKTIGLNLLIFNPLADWIKKLVEWLKFKFPPPILLPFIPFIPGCSPAFYSGRPPLTLLDKDPITNSVEPQRILSPGGFTSQVNLNVPVVPLTFGPGASPDLALTDEQVANLIGSYDPYNLYTSGTIGTVFDTSLNNSNFPTSTGSNSSTRQVQDKLISASNKVTNDIAVLRKDISRVGFIPRPSPLDDLLCKPGER
jgi:hypothetical protein